jgi:hypothetical protein
MAKTARPSPAPTAQPAQLANLLEATARETLTNGHPQVIALFVDELIRETGRPVAIGVSPGEQSRTYHGDGDGVVLVDVGRGESSSRQYRLSCNSGTPEQWQTLTDDIHGIITHLAERIPGAREKVCVRIASEME